MKFVGRVWLCLCMGLFQIEYKSFMYASFVPDVSAISFPTQKKDNNKRTTQSRTALKIKQAQLLDALTSPVEKDVPVQAQFAAPPFYFHDRKSWMQACAQLPTNIDIMNKTAQRQTAFLLHPFIHSRTQVYQEFTNALTQTCQLFQNGPLAQIGNWTTKGLPSAQFYENPFTLDTQNRTKFFEPYIQKLDVRKHDKIVFHGDLHGDIHSLLAVLNWLEKHKILQPDSFTLLDKNVYLVFLGDYVDRGYYGVEVIYTLLRLKIANPEQVILVRGNHEDIGIDMRNLYSFKDELIAKFGMQAKLLEHVLEHLYNFFPLALYVGHENNYIQCCHGGVEHGYQPALLLRSDAQFDLLGTLSRLQSLTANNHKIGCMVSSLQKDGSYNWFHPHVAADFIPTGLCSSRGTIGFAWFDFTKIGPSFWNADRGLAADELLTRAILDYQNQGSVKKVRGIFRGHQHAYTLDQHNPTNLMSELVASHGVYKLWRPVQTSQLRHVHDGIVFTFNAAPDSVYGQGNRYRYDAFGILYVEKEYKDWVLSVHNIGVITE